MKAFTQSSTQLVQVRIEDGYTKSAKLSITCFTKMHHLHVVTQDDLTNILTESQLLA